MEPHPHRKQSISIAIRFGEITRNWMSSVCLCIGLATILGPAAFAWADLETAQKAYDRGDFSSAFNEWIPMAEQGNAEAQYRVGRLYERGEGVSLEDSRAAHWYGLAAKQGHVEAQTNLGYLYATGRGVPKDRSQASRWFRSAAEKGDDFAQEQLAVLYELGDGVQEDQVEAARWYLAAAEQGKAVSQFSLALKYSSGRGVPKDLAQAFLWNCLAASQLGPEGDAVRESAAVNIYLLLKKMTPEELLAAQKLLKEWKPKENTKLK